MVSARHGSTFYLILGELVAPSNARAHTIFFITLGNRVAPASTRHEASHFEIKQRVI